MKIQLITTCQGMDSMCPPSGKCVGGCCHDAQNLKSANRIQISVEDVCIYLTSWDWHKNNTPMLRPIAKWFNKLSRHKHATNVNDVKESKRINLGFFFNNSKNVVTSSLLLRVSLGAPFIWPCATSNQKVL